MRYAYVCVLRAYAWLFRRMRASLGAAQDMPLKSARESCRALKEQSVEPLKRHALQECRALKETCP
jgi:hypothetical protein